MLPQKNFLSFGRQSQNKNVFEHVSFPEFGSEVTYNSNPHHKLPKPKPSGSFDTKSTLPSKHKSIYIF